MSTKSGRATTATRLSPLRDWLLIVLPELAKSGLLVGKMVEVGDVVTVVK